MNQTANSTSTSTKFCTDPAVRAHEFDKLLAKLGDLAKLQRKATETGSKPALQSKRQSTRASGESENKCNNSEKPGAVEDVDSTQNHLPHLSNKQVTGAAQMPKKTCSARGRRAERDTLTAESTTIHERLDNVENLVTEMMADLAREAERLRCENEELAKVKEENEQLRKELDVIKRHVGLLPLSPHSYRRSQDPYGAPFAVWRRSPATVAYRPPPINTRRAAKFFDHRVKALPIVTQSESPIQISFGRDGREEAAKAEQRDDDRASDGALVLAKVEARLDKSFIPTQAATSSKRAHEAESSDSDLRSPPTKRLRDKEFHWIKLAARGPEEAGEQSGSVGNAIMKPPYREKT